MIKTYTEEVRASFINILHLVQSHICKDFLTTMLQKPAQKLQFLTHVLTCAKFVAYVHFFKQKMHFRWPILIHQRATHLRGVFLEQHLLAFYSYFSLCVVP